MLSLQTKQRIKIVGGGLAGCEAAYQLLKRGFAVDMFEMRPEVGTPAHTSGQLAELVCSNSLKSEVMSSAQGVLKAELKVLDSLILKTAERVRVPAGAALAVDREKFSDAVHEELSRFVDFNLVRKECNTIENDTIIATGPLTSPAMAQALATKLGESYLTFFDAVAPIVTLKSVDMSRAFWGARYGKGDADYLNCPMDKDEYETFVSELVSARKAGLHSLDSGRVFEGCMPVEVMAARGPESLRFGPLRPVGLYDNEGRRAYAVVQLRQEDAYKQLVNLVGFQTNLAFGEQERVFGLIPALKNADFVRYGKMHRNTFINAPKTLDFGLKVKDCDSLFIAGQLTGVEGYLESTLSGLLAAINMVRVKRGLELSIPDEMTVSGALLRYLSSQNKDFQPMHVSFELVPPLEKVYKDKTERKLKYGERAVEHIKLFDQQ